MLKEFRDFAMSGIAYRVVSPRKRISAKIGRLIDAVRVMPGLVPMGANLRLSLGLSKPYPSYVDGPLARPVLHFDRHWQLLSYVRPVGAAHCPLALMTFDDLGPNHDGGLEAHDG
jgi:hypothetical protein